MSAPVDDTLFEWPPAGGSDLLRLVAGECRGCGLVVFPRQADCPRCMGDDLSARSLSTRGTLWTFTTQGYPPKSPPYLGPVGEDFVPFAVGYLELDGAVRVEGRLDVDDPARLRIGMEMDVVALPLPTATGTGTITFAFRPARTES